MEVIFADNFARIYLELLDIGPWCFTVLPDLKTVTANLIFKSGKCKYIDRQNWLNNAKFDLGHSHTTGSHDYDDVHMQNSRKIIKAEINLQFTTPFNRYSIKKIFTLFHACAVRCTMVYDVTFCFISPVREMKQNVTS